MSPPPATLAEAYQAIHEADAHVRAAEVALIVGIAKAAELYEVDDAAVMEAVEGFLSGSLRWWQVAEVVNRPAVYQLNAEAASRLDRKLAVALRLWSWQRIRRNLEAWIIAADPEMAREREARQRENRYVAVDAVKNGHCALYGLLDPRDAIDFDHALSEVAKRVRGWGDRYEDRRGDLLARRTTKSALDRAFEEDNTARGSPGRPQ